MGATLGAIMLAFSASLSSWCCSGVTVSKATANSTCTPQKKRASGQSHLFRRFIVGKMFALPADKLADKSIIPDDDWHHEELENDVALPVINTRLQ
jgi:hypothetical protein